MDTHSHYPTSAELAAFRRSIYHPHRGIGYQPLPYPLTAPEVGAYPSERRLGIGYLAGADYPAWDRAGLHEYASHRCCRRRPSGATAGNLLHRTALRHPTDQAGHPQRDAQRAALAALHLRAELLTLRCPPRASWAASGPAHVP